MPKYESYERQCWLAIVSILRRGHPRDLLQAFFPKESKNWQALKDDQGRTTGAHFGSERRKGEA